MAGGGSRSRRSTPSAGSVASWTPPPDLSPLIGSYAVRTGIMSSIALAIAQTPSGHARRHIASPPPPTCYLVCNEVHGLPTHLAFKFFYSFPLNSPFLFIMSPYSSHMRSLEPGYGNEPGSSRLYPRKGGHGGKGGGSSSGGSGKGSSGGSSGRSSGTEKSVPISGSTGGRSTATAYGFGGGAAKTIPAGQLFAGRISGGGTRDQVYGTR